MAMATKLKLSKDAQKKIVSYVSALLTHKGTRQEMYNKMEAIDQAYARYKALDEEAGTVSCGDLFRKDSVIAPIVVSQVDSHVAYLAEVFLSGSPLFPVVSTPAKRKMAEQLETLIDDHATIGGYARQLLMYIRDGVKYNICALEADWDSLEQFNIVADWKEADSRKLTKANRYITKLQRLDMYNTFWDDSVAPAEVSQHGDYAGYVNVFSRIRMKTLLNKWSADDEAYNAQAIMQDNGASTNSYVVHPEISDYVTAKRPRGSVDWDAWFGGSAPRKAIGSGEYEVACVYARIIPSEFGIIGPQPNTPQIWKLVVVNGKHLAHARRIVSAYNRLPILFGQPHEDGFGYQTQSVAEAQVPIQDAATTLFNMRFAAARRAVSDRALYDPEMIPPDAVNSATPAPKIPVKINPLSPKPLDAAYKQIPFDLRGTETAFQDAAVLVDFSKQLSGLNSPQQGQFQKGNKSVQEWQDTMGGSDGRLRLLALSLEYQVFVWLKFILLLNIYQYGEDSVVVSQKTGEVLDVKLEELRKEVLSFRVSDGYTPKSKMASADMLANGLNMLMNSPILQQAYGTSLPSMFAHMMQLGGVRGLEEYAPEIQPQAGAVSSMPATPAQPIPPGGQPQ
jgi:hypothetical protein